MTKFALLSVLSAGLILMGSDITAATKYFKIKGHMIWSEALNNCRAMGGWPASIKTATEQSEVAALTSDAITTWAYGSGYWIGLRQEKYGADYIWNIDNSISTYFNWHPKEPSRSGWNGTVSPLCIGVTWDGGWIDIDCNDVEEGVICEYLSSATNTTTTALRTSTTTSAARSTETASKTAVSTSTTESQTTTNPVAAISTTRIPSEAPIQPSKSNGLSIQSLIPSDYTERVEYLDNTNSVADRCQDFDANHSAPPSLIPGVPLEIGVAFQITCLNGISNVDQTIGVTGILLFNWKVETCPWNSSNALSDEHREQVRVVSPERVWQPGFRFISAANSNIYMKNANVGDDFLAFMDAKPEKTKPNRTFDFYWTREGAFTSSCALQLDQFPFDQQTCAFEFALLRNRSLVLFTEHSLNLFCENGVADNTEWKIVKTSKSLRTESVQGKQVSVASFAITLQRLPSYYIDNLFIPCGVLGVLELGAFMIPPNESSRAAFTVTIVLALTVAQTEVLNHVPKKPSTNLLSLYVQRMIWFSAGCTIYELFVLLVSSGKASAGICGKRVRAVRLLDIIAFLVGLGAMTAINAIFVVNIF